MRSGEVKMSRMMRPSVLPVLLLASYLTSSLAAQTFIAPLMKSHNSHGGQGRRHMAEGAAVGANNVGTGAFFVPMEIGTPPQRYNAVFDTGSGVVHTACVDYGYQIPIFVPSRSSTLEAGSCGKKDADDACQVICGSKWPKNECPQPDALPSNQCTAGTCVCTEDGKCLYQISYGDGGGASGPIYTDEVGLFGSGMPKTRMAFGCAGDYPGTTYNEKAFKGDAPYLAGMNFQDGSFYSQLKNQGMIDPVLGFCLGDGTYGQWETDAADGKLILGNLRANNLKEEYTTQLIQETAWANPSEVLPPGLWVELQSIRVGDGKEFEPESPDGTAMILDTGTSGVVLPSSLYNIFAIQMLTALNTSDLTTHVTFDQASGLITAHFDRDVSTKDLDDAFPMLYVTMGPGGRNKITLPIPPSSYLSNFSTSAGVAWITVVLEATDNRVIMGNIWMNNLFVQADQRNGLLTLGRTRSRDCTELTFEPGPETSAPPPVGKKGGKKAGTTSGKSGKKSGKSGKKAGRR